MYLVHTYCAELSTTARSNDKQASAGTGCGAPGNKKRFQDAGVSRFSYVIYIHSIPPSPQLDSTYICTRRKDCEHGIGQFSCTFATDTHGVGVICFEPCQGTRAGIRNASDPGFEDVSWRHRTRPPHRLLGSYRMCTKYEAYMRPACEFLFDNW